MIIVVTMKNKVKKDIIEIMIIEGRDRVGADWIIVVLLPLLLESSAVTYLLMISSIVSPTYLTS